jgi:hypothetical protein
VAEGTPPVTEAHMKSFTHYWRSDTWDTYRGRTIPYSGGNGLVKRGLQVGDRIYVVTVRDGSLYVGGYLDVGQLVDRQTARKIMGREVWEAEEFAIPKNPQHFLENRRVPLNVTRSLRFRPAEKGLVFSGDQLDRQTLRGLRELTPESAEALESLIGKSRSKAVEVAVFPSSLKSALRAAWDEAGESERAFLIAHYGLAGHTGSAGEIAKAAGFASYQNTNANYGAFARRVAERLGETPVEWLATIVNATDYNDAGHRNLQMKPSVVKAIEELGVISPGPGGTVLEALEGITRESLIAAMAHLKRGDPHRFSDSTKYDVLFEGRRYPPKAVVGLAAEQVSGRSLGPDDFSAGIGSKCFRVLKALGFAVVPKSDADSDEWEDDLAEEELRQRTQLGPTELDQLIKARRGQGIYRENLQGVEKSCRITGLSDRRHLRASHIKPWRDCDDRERLDGFNGLLLSPHIDHLFDQGHISFSDEGEMLVSRHLNPAVLKRWGLGMPCNVGAFAPEQRVYLAYHRANIFERDAGGRRSG